MKVGIVICARSGSKRLPKKHLISLGKESSPLRVLCTRLHHLVTVKNAELCIATTTNKDDDAFEEFQADSLRVFRGDSSNIPKRQLQAAKAYGYDVIVSVDGDDILTSPEAINKVVEVYTKDLQREEKVFYSSGLPLGMNVSCYSTKLLDLCLVKNNQKQLETGWGRIFVGITQEEVAVDSYPFPREEIRFTLDYNEDLEFFKAIFDYFGESIYRAPSLELVKFVTDHSVYKKNSMVAAKYWENFYSEKKKEENQ